MGRHGSVSQIKEALERRSFEELVGLVEDTAFEGKDTPYSLDTDWGKFELAKDVSAMANAAGGVIVLGVRTSKNAEQEDEVTEIRLLPPDRVNIPRHQDVLRSWTFPSLEGVEIAWFEERNGTGRGLVGIFIAGNSTLKPFLMGAPLRK
jgi:hypothetical protein